LLTQLFAQTNEEIKCFNRFKKDVVQAEVMTGPHKHHGLASSDAQYLKITKETDLKREIRDIQDELNTITVLLADQTTVTKKFQDNINPRGKEHMAGWDIGGD
jgi:hypothetical protein